MVIPAVVFHGVVAILIILVILAIIIAGVFTLMRGIGRGAKGLARKAAREERRR